MNTSEPGGKLMIGLAIAAVAISIGWIVYYGISMQRPPVPRGPVTSTPAAGTMALTGAASQGHGPMAMAARAASHMPDRQ